MQHYPPQQQQQQQTALEELYRRIQEIDQKLQYVERREQEGWRTASQQISALVENSRATTTAVANLELKISKDIQFVEEQLARDVQTEAQQRAEGEARMRKLLADEAASIRSSVSASEKDRFNEVDHLLEQLTTTLSTMCSQFEEKITDISAQLSKTLDVTRREASTVEEMVARSKTERERAELNLLAVVEETCVVLHQQIATERQERAASQARLEKMILDLTTRQTVRF